jgi:peptidyl-dipeptidase A
MKPARAVLALGIAAVLGLSGCNRQASPDATGAAATPDRSNETADQFIARVNEEYKKIYPELTAAQWLSSTYINDDSQLLSAKANERYLSQLNSWIEQSRRFEGQQMSPQTARAIQLLKLSAAMPPPRDPAKLTELTQIATRMEGMYGSG